MILFESSSSVGLFALIFAVVYGAMMLGLFLALRAGSEIRTRDDQADRVHPRSRNIRPDPPDAKTEHGTA